VLRRILIAIICVGLMNFAALWVISSAVGDAWHGKVEDGRYYLGKHANGPFLEVTPEVFTASLWHVRSVLVTHALAIAAAWILSRWEEDPGERR
jgi:hypothetical protein